jgi:putative ABC transport system substrate-binding protein
MRRRQFVGLTVPLAFIALGAPCASVLAQARPEKPKGVGFLAASAAGSGVSLAPWLAELGYRDGENIRFEYRFPAGRDDRLPALATDLVQRKVDVIVASGLPAIRAAAQATQAIPVVMIAEGDPVKAGFVASLARPGRNVTGISVLASELTAKRLEILKAMDPGLKRVAVLWNPADPDKEEEWRAAETAARVLAIELHPAPVRTREELEGALDEALKAKSNAILVMSGALVFAQARRIAALAQEKRLPAMYPASHYVDPAQGGLVSYGPNLVELSRRAATFVDRILKGAKPAELAVEQPTRIEFAVNVRAAKAQGIVLPPAVLIRADRLFE